MWELFIFSYFPLTFCLYSASVSHVASVLVLAGWSNLRYCKPQTFFLFFCFDVVLVLHRRAPRRHFRNTPPNSAAQLRHNGIPQKPFMSSATADRKCVETPTEDYFVILCIVCEHEQRVIHARLVTPLTAQSPSLFGSERERFITALFWL